MYPYYAKVSLSLFFINPFIQFVDGKVPTSQWIRSHRDLPLKLNQWNSVVRWEFKNPRKRPSSLLSLLSTLTTHWSIVFVGLGRAIPPNPRVPLARRSHCVPNQERSRRRSTSNPRPLPTSLRRTPRSTRHPRCQIREREIRWRIVHYYGRRIHSYYWTRYSRRNFSLPRTKLFENVWNQRRRPCKPWRRQIASLAKLLGFVN